MKDVIIEKIAMNYVSILFFFFFFVVRGNLAQVFPDIKLAFVACMDDQQNCNVIRLSRVRSFASERQDRQLSTHVQATDQLECVNARAGQLFRMTHNCNCKHLFCGTYYGCCLWY